MRRRDFLATAASAGVAAGAFSNSVFFAAEKAAADSVEEKSLRLCFKDDGTFKIAQFTDTHYRVNSKIIAIESVRLIEETLDTEKPQLVVYTGDIVANKAKFVGNITQGWDDILAPCIDRKIPYAVVFGNHERDHSEMSRRDIVHYIAKKPYSLIKPSPPSITTGDTDYVLEIFDNDKIANLIYCIDSGDTGCTYGGGYNALRGDHIQWYREQSSAYTKQNGGQPIPALTFFHIPVNEYSEMIHFKERDKAIIVGKRQEDECTGAINGGMFLAIRECGDTMGIFVGHDHVNDYIGMWSGIALAYGRWSGTMTTYGSDKITQGSRLIELTKNTGHTFKTWIRQRGGKIIDNINVPNDLTRK
ncbi:MAG: metallophosphoesterase family protein [Planctomycetaceae bacterium]|jgi:hypothetical protein|nr:metallophosphoesterase family protein [Planctomycetaceae bacterium]